MFGLTASPSIILLFFKLFKSKVDNLFSTKINLKRSKTEACTQKNLLHIRARAMCSKKMISFCPIEAPAIGSLISNSGSCQSKKSQRSPTS